MIVSWWPSDFMMYVCMNVIIHELVFVVVNAVLYLIYASNLPFFEQFKVSEKPWPWKQESPVREEYLKQTKKSLPVVLFNHLVMAPLIMVVGYDGVKKRMKSSPDALPSWYTIIFQIFLCMVIEDTIFYWTHRMLHHPKIYYLIHKKHHEYKTTIGVAAEYAHPLEYVVSNMLPFSIGPLIVGMHYYTFWMWMILRVGETIDGHCGYAFPWSPYRLLPFSGSALVHDFHHSHVVCNFASFFTWWDHLMKTDNEYLRWLEKRQPKVNRVPTDKGNVESFTPQPTKVD